MNSDTQQAMLNRWLDITTARLPLPVADSVRRELEAHYQDAVETYIAGAVDEAEARKLALLDLGNPAQIASGLERVHFSRYRCLLSTLVCLVYPLALISMPFVAQRLDIYRADLIWCLTSALVILYTLQAYKALIHASIRSLDRPIGLLSVTQLFLVSIAILYYLLYHRFPLFGPGDSIPGDLPRLGIAVMEISLIVADISCGLGVLWMGATLLRKVGCSLKFARLTGILLIALGGDNLLGNLAAVFDRISWVNVSLTLGYGIETIALLVMAFFFWISIPRRSSHSTQVL